MFFNTTKPACRFERAQILFVKQRVRHVSLTLAGTLNGCFGELIRALPGRAVRWDGYGLGIRPPPAHPRPNIRRRPRVGWVVCSAGLMLGGASLLGIVHLLGLRWEAKK